MRFLFVLPRIVSGGVERVTLNLIRGFRDQGHDCALALRRAHGELLDEGHLLTDIHELAPISLHQFVPNLVHLIRGWKPTHVITAFADIAVLTWTAMRLAGSRARWIHGVHSTHAPASARKGILGVSRQQLDIQFARFVYRRADAIVAVSGGVRQEIIGQFGICQAKVVTIYNPVVPDDELREMREPRHPPDQPFTIIAIGRLAYEKGFDVLIDTMKNVPLPWRLDICGEGPERARLQTLIDAQGMNRSIRLPGYTADPYSVLRHADLFVLSSRFEGLPTVLIEALACQCQIVATNCLHGPREVLENGSLGRIVPVENTMAMADAIRKSIAGQDRTDPARLLQRARTFTVSSATEKWLKLCRSTQHFPLR